MSIEIEFNAIGKQKLLQNGLEISSFSGKYRFHDYCKFTAPIVCVAQLPYDKWIEIDAFTGIYGGKIGYAKIGRYCSIAAGVDIGSDQHPVDWVTSSMVAYSPGLHGWDRFLHPDSYEAVRKNKLPPFISNTQVTIGNDVWIGQGVFIKSGVRIGNGAIVGAHSVVTKDIPDYAIVVGVPAKAIKYRFDDKTIEKLLKLNWWDYSIYDFQNINFSKIDHAIESMEIQIADKKMKPYTPKAYTPLDILDMVGDRP